jgi:hypothetical protein
VEHKEEGENVQHRGDEVLRKCIRGEKYIFCLPILTAKYMSDLNASFKIDKRCFCTFSSPKYLCMSFELWIGVSLDTILRSKNPDRMNRAQRERFPLVTARSSTY